MRFTEHPLRRQVVGEMHLRRFPRLSPPAQVIQFVRLLTDEEREAELAALHERPLDAGQSSRHAESRWSDDIRLFWERHSEASTLTLTWTGTAAQPQVWNWPRHDPRAEALDWAEKMPGQVIRATHILIVAEEDEALALVGQAEFHASHLVSCHVAGGARIWSDFRIHGDGYGRLVVAANGLPPGDLARCLQRLQELGNYRNLALLGLPAVQAGWRELDHIEQAIAGTGQAMLAQGSRDDELLEALCTQNAALLAIAGKSDFRVSATAAYARIVADRLAELDVEPIAEFQSLTDFSSRRFNPAMRTCEAFSARLALLGDRTARFTALLRTRIETHIENQNARLLASMDRSARMQLRLQHLVEGLSVVAISYYALGLLSYPVKAAEKLWHGFSATLAMAVLAPLVMIGVFALLKGLKKRLISPDDKISAKDA